MRNIKAPRLALATGWALFFGLVACSGPGVETCNEALEMMKKGVAPKWSIAKAQVIKKSQMIESVCQAQIQYKRTFEGTKDNKPAPAAQREFYILTVHHSEDAAEKQRASYAKQAAGADNPALSEQGFTNIYIRGIAEQNGKITLVSQMLCEDRSSVSGKKKKKKKKGQPATGALKKGIIDECAALMEEGNKMTHAKVGKKLTRKVLKKD